MLTPAMRSCAAIEQSIIAEEIGNHARDERAVWSDCRGIRHRDYRCVERHAVDGFRFVWVRRGLIGLTHQSITRGNCLSGGLFSMLTHRAYSTPEG